MCPDKYELKQRVLKQLIKGVRSLVRTVRLLVHKPYHLSHGPDTTLSEHHSYTSCYPQKGVTQLPFD